MFSLALVLISVTTALPAIAVEPNSPPVQIPANMVVAQPRTFSTLGSLFGGGYSTAYRYPEGHRGYPNYGSAYSGSIYGGNPASVVPQQVVPAYSGGYGGYGWRGGSDNRGYGQQSGWANQATSGWSGNYGR